ncbi:iron uptake transporter deferrochelatase/peroxidase subunit [Nostoc sp. TCL240-02]|uniref:iron uptake transporter deferrochelatase/peroxidase subunit n=1 Tax=Nostoc sp. TCL240-02 TaxID=2572090 RepID=UPI00157FB77F|nr:iron uptake transporter deferrochelatase/peroxidase subunit [Nostoc sp. TCL240-02]QKQ73716.1 deferrochelatase/peroxidase EfeB [Nostoc sp. TCL240-02]
MSSTVKKPDLHITPRISRRDLLIGMAAAGGVAALTTLSFRTFFANTEDTTQERQLFFGIHQAGIITPTPASALIVSFDVLAKTKEDLVRLFKTLTERIEFLMVGGNAKTVDPKLPPNDSGVLGTKVFPDNLTVTVAVGASLFDNRYSLSNLKPKHLTTMTSFPNDALDANLCHGDLLLQFCSNTAETNIHGLRDIIKNFPDLLSLRWKMEGFLPPHTIKKLGKDTVRNLLGFKDGTANLDVSNSGLMNRVVWVQPNTNEPAWTTGGTYQVVRVIRNFVERWDRTPLQEQQTIIGRDKDIGAPLGMKNEHDIPKYEQDSKGKRIPLNAHIRLANPRQSELGLILRRGFNYSRGYDKSGQLDMGLLFVCFQSNLEKGFITVQERLNGEPLEEYIKPMGGGYFFTLPGVLTKGGYLGQSLLEAGIA